MIELLGERERARRHARLTVTMLEDKLGKRGSSYNSRKIWERKLLFSAYQALDIPKSSRKFGLDRVEKVEDIRTQW